MFGLRAARIFRPPSLAHRLCRATPTTRFAALPQHPICLLNNNHNAKRHISIASLFQRPTTQTPSPRTVAEISKLEAVADADPDNVASQVHLFQELLNTQSKTGRNLVMSRWERMCEFNPSSPLLQSDQAFQLYLTALVQSGLSSSVHHAVQRRDALLRAHSPSLMDPIDKDSTPSSADALTSPSQPLSSSSPLAPSARLTNSQTIAQQVLATASSPVASQAPGTTIASSLSPNQQLAALVGAGGGGMNNPVHVVLSEPRSVTWRKIIRSTALILVFGFFGLVVFAMVLEHSNLLKTGPRTAEFEPMQGKVVKFSDVHGVDEAKEELQEVVEFLKDPSTFTTLGGKLPKGILLTGSPGTGKTMLARAVAGEAGVPFLFASGSEFEEVFVGVGAKRVRDLFATARKKQPAIIFIDELDAIGGKRSSRDQQHLRQTLNQLLVEMDGFMQTEGVVVIAATNFPESLDQALVRPGRFDRIIAVPLPDVRGRVQILQHHMRNVTTAPDVDPMILARGTPGFSGADLQNMVNQAAIQASKEGAHEVTLKHFEWAKDRIIMGAERKTHYIDPKVKKMTAYHEGGHALVALYTEGAMPLHKVTCVTRGHALGLTQFLPEDDQVSISKKEYQAAIDVSMGGRIAEELSVFTFPSHEKGVFVLTESSIANAIFRCVFDETVYGPENVTSGASSDIRNATNTASAMVRHFGFSDKIGPVFYHEADTSISPQKREAIESEIQRMLEEGQNRARRLLKEKEVELHRLAEALVEYETLDLQEVKKVISGEPIRSVEEKLQDAGVVTSSSHVEDDKQPQTASKPEKDVEADSDERTSQESIEVPSSAGDGRPQARETETDGQSVGSAS